MSGATMKAPAPWPAPPAIVTADERNAALNANLHKVRQALADVIILTQRRDALDAPANANEQEIANKRHAEIGRQLGVARGAFASFEELLNA